MNRCRAAPATVALVLAMLASAGARVQQTRVAPASGTVAGRVELTESSQRTPLRRATVTLVSESGKLTRTTATDKDGAYRFDGIAAGSYQASAGKAGFLCEIATPGSGAGTSGLLAVAGGSVQVVNFVAQPAAALEGRFIEDTGKPIPGLTVTADRLADVGGQQAGAGSYSAKTDDLGRFRVHTIPPGMYRLHATPPPPASGSRFYYPGTEKADDAGVMKVTSGQTIDNLMVTVPVAPLSAIAAEAIASVELEAMSAPTSGGAWAEVTGHVTRSDTGLPIVDAAVKLSTGAGALLRTAWTNGAGEFVFGRVMAGSYLLTASADGHTAPDANFVQRTGRGMPIEVKGGDRLKMALVLSPLSAIEGRVLDEFGEPAPGIVVQLAQRVLAEGEPRFMNTGGTGRTDDRGWFRIPSLVPGDYYFFALPEPFARSGPAPFPITYFPGTPSWDAATPIRIVAGIDAHGVNLTLPSSGSATINVTVTDQGGLPVESSRVLIAPLQGGQIRSTARAQLEANAGGTLVLRGVPEGTYVLQAAGPQGFGTASVMVDGSGERNLAVRVALRPLGSVRGRLVFDGDAPPVRSGIGGLRYQPTDFTGGPAGGTGNFAVTATDWSFRLSDIASPGVIRASVPGEGSGWVLSGVLLQGRDITDVPYDFHLGDVDGLEVVMTRRVGGITGTVHGGSEPARGVPVVVMGADGDSWAYLTRTMRSAQTSEFGTFTVKGLLPGRYFVIAGWTNADRSDLASLLAQRATGTLVVVSQGADTAVRLTVLK